MGERNGKSALCLHSRRNKILAADVLIARRLGITVKISKAKQLGIYRQ